MFQTGLLAGKRILVTGGGTGLGRSMATRCAELGAAIVICGRRAEVLTATAAEMSAATGARVDTHVIDIRLPDAVEAMMDALWQTGPLDGLINNAAANFVARTETLSPRAAAAILDITMHGPLHVTLAAGRRWIADKRRAAVMSIIASYAWHGSPYVVPSAMAKAGVLAMTRSLAVEWGPKGIRFTAVSPGAFPTKGAWDRLMPPGMAERYETRNPLGRPGRHEELANLAAFLISDQAEYLNGADITIDGGAWLKGSGNFSPLETLTEEQWAMMRPKKEKA